MTDLDKTIANWREHGTPQVNVTQTFWYAELGYCDGNGIGQWEGTEASHKCNTKEGAEAIRDAWLEDGTLEKTRWDELRPTYDYGLFRLRRSEEPAPTLAEAYETQAKRIAEFHGV